MSLLAAITKKASPYAGSGLGYAAPYLDAFNKSIAPTPNALIREMLGTAYACTMLNANLVASTPLRLYIRGKGASRLRARGETRALRGKRLEHAHKVMSQQGKTSDDIVEEVTEHPAIDLLRRPLGDDNEDGVGMSTFTLFQVTQAYQEVTGRMFWYAPLDGPGGTPSALWPLMPQLMTLIRGSYGEPLVKSYLFSGGGLATRFDPSEIIPFRMLDLYDPFTGGFSPLRASYEKIRIDRKSDALVSATVDNGGRPSAIYSPSGTADTGFIGAAEAKRLSSAFKQAFSRSGAGGIMVSDTPGTLDILNWPINEIIDAARAGMNRTDIAASFGVPDTLLNRKDTNLASARTGDYAHAKDAGLPRLRANEAALNQFLIPMYGDEAKDRLFFAYDDPEGLRDLVLEAEQSRVAAARGSITRNEDRIAMGLPPVPWGDQPTIQKDQIPVDMTTGIPIPPPAPEADDEDDDDSGDTTKSIVDAVAAVLTPQLKSLGQRIGAVDKRTRRLAKKANQELINGHAREPVALRPTPEIKSIATLAAEPIVINPINKGTQREYPTGKRIAHGVVDVFEKQRQAVLAHIAAVNRADDEERKREEEALLLLLLAIDFDDEQWNTAVANATGPAYQAISTTQGSQLLASIASHVPGLNIHRAFPKFETNVDAAAEAMAEQLGPWINKTTTDDLHAAIDKLKELGLATMEAIRATIDELFDAAVKTRGPAIGENEAVRATMTGEQVAAAATVNLLRSMGVKLQKAWVCEPTACDFCLDIEALGWIDEDEPFGMGIEEPPDPHENCRCSIVRRVLKI